MESPALKILPLPAPAPGHVVADFGLPPAERVEGFLRMLDGQRISQEEIVRITGVCRRAVQLIIGRLKRGHWLEVTPALAGFPSRYLFRKPCAEDCAALRRNAPRQTDDHNPRSPAPPETTGGCGPADGPPTIHTTHTPHVMGHGLKTHGRLRASKKHGRKWNFTPDLLRNDHTLLDVAMDYAAMGWVAQGEPGLVIIFEAAEHALESIGAKGRSKARSPGAIFVARVRDHRQGKFKPITHATEDRARLRLKSLLYDEQPGPRSEEGIL